MLKRSITAMLSLLYFFCIPVIGQSNITGDWYGTLETGGGLWGGGATLNIIFHIAESDDGYTTTLESLGSIMPAMLSLEGNSLTITIENWNINYVATINADEIAGTYTQDDVVVPDLILSRKKY